MTYCWPCKLLGVCALIMLIAVPVVFVLCSFWALILWALQL